MSRAIVGGIRGHAGAWMFFGLVGTRGLGLKGVGYITYGTKFSVFTVASEKDGFMSETMINYRNLPNPHLCEPLFYTRA